MIYLKIVYRSIPRISANSREYVRLDDCANIASFLCARALENQVSIRDILCQVYTRKEWRAEQAEWEKETENR